MKRSLRAIGLSLSLAFAQLALADTHISNVTFEGDAVFIKLDTGTPSNCTGTTFGWLMIPAPSKPMIAFVMGLWLRGDILQAPVVVYTSGVDGSGYCQVTQLDPIE